MLIHEMLEETAKRYPGKVAVKHGDRTITFSELDEQSSRLAGCLESKSIEIGDRVAIMSKKSIETVCSIFGVLKVGGIYIPIDPELPKQRIEHILDDCNVKDIQYPGYSMKIPWNWWECHNTFQNDIPDTASAYIIYTSGSTGEPKGVEIYHHSVTNLMEWYAKEFNITTKDKILSFVPFWFDASICDLFAMAKVGATLVLPPEGINMFPGEFAKFLVDEQISLFFAPSSQFVLALSSLKPFKYPHLKTVMFGAEELPMKYVRELQKVFLECELVNIYGPTECTDIATFYRVPKQLKDMENIPIGKPYPGVRTTRINEDGFSCIEDNEIGELHIYGNNVMKGYWNNAKETNNVFEYPIFLKHGTWYSTGDLVCKDENGNYVYVGRKDRQIKSMGRRIQLEEIEHILNEYSLLKEAVVTSEQDVNVESRINIECYVVPLAPLTEGEIIRYCRTRLPDYMTPTKVYICDTLPKTGTGKLNRGELK